MSSNPHGRNPHGPTLDGIDVASPQGDVFDWTKVAADGVRFAWMQVDHTFARNWRLSRAAGVLRGAYGFFRADQDPIVQADTLLRQIGSDFTDDDLHPMIDVEVTRGQSPDRVLDGALRWCEHVKTRLGRPTVWYTFPSFATNPPTAKPPGLGGLTRPEMADLLLWISHFVVDPNNGVAYKLAKPIIPKPWASFALWQTSGNKGPRIPGIACDVDRDVFWGDEAAFRALFSMVARPTPAEGIPTRRDTPAAIAAVREPIADYSISDPATLLRAGEGEHTVKPEDE